MTDQKQSADPTIDGALDTLRRLDGLGEYAYTANAAVLITEARARAAVADAVTNRIRLLGDLLSGNPNTLHPDLTAQATHEHDRLVRSVVITHAEA